MYPHLPPKCMLIKKGLQKLLETGGEVEDRCSECVLGEVICSTDEAIKDFEPDVLGLCP